MTKKPTLTVIDGSEPPDTPLERVRRRMRASVPAELVRCPRCSSNAIMQIRLGMIWSRKRAVGGQKQLICADCHGRGEYVPISS